jgi:hypothetical protein
MTTSALIRDSSFLDICGLPFPISLILCLMTSSSASSEACQKKRYGEVVVPKIATKIIAKPELNSM